MSSLKGLELLFSLKQREFKSKGDCAIAAIHCILINDDFSCVGTGEEFLEQDSESATELLPEKWNDCQDVYCLRYRCKNLQNRYLLKAVLVENKLHVNLVVNEENIYGMTINLDEFVSEDYSKFSEAYKNLIDLNDNFHKQVLKNIASTKSQADLSSYSEDTRKSRQQTSDSTPSRVPIALVEPICASVPDYRNHGRNPSLLLPPIGSSDLDPMGRTGGGMLFDPTGIPARPFGRGGLGPVGGSWPAGLPPHAIPSGARFDPFTPISPDRFNPDPDHLRPPDYNDMYM